MIPFSILLLSNYMILTIHRFYGIWILPPLKFTRNHQIQAVLCFWGHSQSYAEKQSMTRKFPFKVRQGDTPRGFSSHTVNQSPSYSLNFSAVSFLFLLFVKWFLLFKWSPSMLLKCCSCSQVQKGCDLPSGENIMHVLDTLPSRLEFISGVLYEFNVSTSSDVHK